VGLVPIVELNGFRTPQQNDGTISLLVDVLMTEVHVQEIGDDIGTSETHEPIK
jgi:hypothetical protein